MNIQKRTSGKILGLAIGCLLVLPAAAEGKDDSVVVRCKGKVYKRLTKDRPEHRDKLSPLKKLQKDDYVAVLPGSSITLMSFADCSKITIAVAPKEAEFSHRLADLPDLKDRRITRETSNNFKAVHVQSDAYQSKIGGASNRGLNGFLICTDLENPKVVLNRPAHKVQSEGPFHMQNLTEDGQAVKSRPWVECQLTVKSAADPDHTVLTFPGLKLKPGQSVKFCPSARLKDVDPNALFTIARYDTATMEKIDAQLRVPKSLEESLEQLSLLTTVKLFERAMSRQAEFEKQFRDPQLWATVQTNLVEVRDLSQNP